MRSFPSSLGVLGSLTLLVAAVALPAAADGRLVEESTEVRYADLDLGKEAGVANLYARLTNAAEQVCDLGLPSSALFLSTAARACVADALQQANVEVDRPALTANHAARAPAGARATARIASARN
jgi:UrcA family protein